MTRKFVERYPYICADIKDLDKLVADTVTACDQGPAFAKHTVSIRGYPEDAIERQQELLDQKREIEAFVESLEDHALRRIVTLRAIEHLSWAQVAARMGWKYSEASVKKRYYRLFSEKN